MTVKLGVLASGRGTNFHSILKAIEAGTLDAKATVLISDREDAPALDLAREHGVEAVHFLYDRKDRTVFENKAIERLKQDGVDLVILAGFMRLITPEFLEAFPHRVLNIHPSLLPSFKGLHAQKQALDYGVKIAGCTVHVVTEDMDAGPIIGQRSVPVRDDDTENTLADRILEQEHILYPEAIARYVEKGFET